MAYFRFFAITLVGLAIFAMNAHPVVAEPINSVEFDSFVAATQRMRASTESIKSLKNSGKVVGHERGLLDPIEGKPLTAQEKEMLDRENADRREYFTFLAKYSNSIYRHEQPRIPDKAAVDYAEVAQYFAKRWKEWPPQQ